MRDCSDAEGFSREIAQERKRNFRGAKYSNRSWSFGIKAPGSLTGAAVVTHSVTYQPWRPRMWPSLRVGVIKSRTNPTRKSNRG